MAMLFCNMLTVYWHFRFRIKFIWIDISYLDIQKVTVWKGGCSVLPVIDTGVRSTFMIRDIGKQKLKSRQI